MPKAQPPSNRDADTFQRYAAVPLTHANNNRGFSPKLEVSYDGLVDPNRVAGTPARSKLRDPSNPAKLTDDVAREEYNRTRPAHYVTDPYGVRPGEHEASPRPRPYSDARPLTQGTSPRRFFASLSVAPDRKERVMGGQHYSAATVARQKVNGAKYGMQPPRIMRRMSRMTDPVATPIRPANGVRLIPGAPPSDRRGQGSGQ